MVFWPPLRRTLILLALFLAGCATGGPKAPDAEPATAPASAQTPAVRRAAAQQPFARGVALARQGETEHAIAVFEELTRQYPELPGPYNNLAVLYAARGEYDRARQVLLKAIEIQPTLDTPHENLGDVYSKLAAEAYGNAFEINSANLRAQSKSELLNRMLLGGTPRSDAVAAELPPTLIRPTPERARPEPQALGCYRIGPIDYRVDAEAVAAWARLQGLEANMHGRPGQADIAYYRVYLPPFPSRDEADRAAENLKTAGLTDVEVIYNGPLQNGISLGVYRQAVSAQRRLAQLKELGVTAVLDARRKERERYAVSISGRGTGNWQRRFAEAFPDQDLRSSPCEEAATTAR